MIESFEGEFRFLSNFCPSPIKFTHPMLGVCLAPTVEHAFAACKTQNGLEAVEVLAETTPGRAKRRGRKVTLRPSWESEKVMVMLNLVREKFRQNPELAKQLLATGEQELVEGNQWGDTFWGVCSGKGENMLGKILMQVRKEMR
jgi:ribA/ribD-fused uncharacterized protein